MGVCEEIHVLDHGETIASGTPDELKTRFMQDDIIEVLCEQPQEAILVLGTVEGVKEAALFGKGLHVVVERQAKGVIPAITNRLAERNFAVSRVERIVPSLEDVFVSLIEARDRQERPQAEVKG
jgi:ABC-2 type transport system ATP-binding protein